MLFSISFCWMLLNIWFRVKYGFPLISKQGRDNGFLNVDMCGDNEFSAFMKVFILILSVLLFGTFTIKYFFDIISFSPVILTVICSLFMPKINIKNKIRKWLNDEI